MPDRLYSGTRKYHCGLESALDGMKVGEAKKVNVKAKDAYGEYDPKPWRKFPI